MVPAYKQMAGLAAALAQRPRRARSGSASGWTSAAPGYDVVVFDGPPSLGLSVTAMLVAATEVVVPVALTYLALDGCAEVARRWSGRRGAPSARAPGHGGGADDVPATALAEAILERLEAYFPGLVTPPLGFNVASTRPRATARRSGTTRPGAVERR